MMQVVDVVHFASARPKHKSLTSFDTFLWNVRKKRCLFLPLFFLCSLSAHLKLRSLIRDDLTVAASLNANNPLVYDHRLASSSASNEEGQTLSAGEITADSYATSSFYYVDQNEIYNWSYPDKISFFTRRTNADLPDWAYRYSFLAEPNKTAGEKSVCFVHVGKTSGSTLACYLGFRYDCGETMMLPKSNLLHQTGHLIHNWINDCPEDDDYYLFALRDPVARIKSWFTYERPNQYSEHTQSWYLRKELFLDCPFHTFRDLVEQGLSDYRVFRNISLTCHRRAWEAIRGYRHFARHNYYNFQYYRDQVPANANILAIRTEFIETDWMSANELVAQGSQKYQAVNTSFPRYNASPNVEKEDRYLTPNGIKLLCRALCPEIKAYVDLLRRAINLTPKQVDDSQANS